MLCFWGDGRRIGLRGRRILFFHWFRHIRAGRGEADRHCLSERASSLREGGSASPFPTNKYLCGYLQPRLGGSLVHCCTYFVAMRSRTAEKLSQEIPREKLFPVGRQNLGKDAHCRPGKGGKITRGGGEGKGLISHRTACARAGRNGLALSYAGQTWPNGMFQRGAKAATDVRAAMGGARATSGAPRREAIPSLRRPKMCDTLPRP